ncbi:MAG: hypothetical protein WCJ01_07410 [Ignavibacteria bacterium]
MKEAGNLNDGKNKNLSSNPQNNDSHQSVLFNMVNQILRLECQAKEIEISSLKKENNLLKRNFEKFSKILSHLLTQSGTDPLLYELLPDGKDEIRAENTISGSEIINSRNNNANSPANHDTMPANHDTTPANHDTMPANHDTTPANYDTMPANHDTTPANYDTMPANHDTTPATRDTTPAIRDTTPAIRDTTPAIRDTTPANHDTTPAIRDTTPANHDTTPASPDTTKSVNRIPQSKIPIQERLPVDFDMVYLAIFHRNIKHSSYIKNGRSKIRPLKYEARTTRSILKWLDSCYRLGNLDEQTNRIVSFSLFMEVRSLLSQKHNVVLFPMKVTEVLMRFYRNKRLTRDFLDNDLGYSRSTCYRLMETLRQNQWVELYNPRTSDAFYFSKKGIQFVEDILNPILKV